MIDHRTLEVTRKGYPALWEMGGATRNQSTSEIKASVVCSSDGHRMRPVFIPTPAVRTKYQGKVLDHFGYAKQHALFIVRPGALLPEASVRRSDLNQSSTLADIKIYEISDVYNRGTLAHLAYEAEIRLLNQRVKGEWRLDVRPEHAHAVRALLEKIKCECHGPHYADCRPEQVCRHLRVTERHLPEFAYKQPSGFRVSETAHYSALTTEEED